MFHVEPSQNVVVLWLLFGKCSNASNNMFAFGEASIVTAFRILEIHIL